MNNRPYLLTWGAQANRSPLEILKAEGTRFWTPEGEWLDFGSFIYQANLGHGHPRMIQAIEEQASSLATTIPNADFPAKRELAHELLKLAPEGFTKVFFTLGGAEANEHAMKMARLYTGRHQFLARKRSYHGATHGAMALSGDYRRLPFEPSFPKVTRLNDCYCDRCPVGKSADSCRLECTDDLVDAIEVNKNDYAALFLESIPGANGVMIPKSGYWEKIREITRNHGVLLVADEVFTGFGRTGTWLGIDHYPGVIPDMITVGKALTGGYSTLGAVLVHHRVADFFEDQFLYSGLTGYAHPLACRVALEAIRIYRDEELIQSGLAMEATLRALLEECFQGKGSEFIRVQGAMAAVEVAWSERQWALFQEALRSQCLYLHCYPRNGCILVTPPLTFTAEDFSEARMRLNKALSVIGAS